jgi:hypothetical protein
VLDENNWENTCVCREKAVPLQKEKEVLTNKNKSDYEIIVQSIHLLTALNLRSAYALACVEGVVLAVRGFAWRYCCRVGRFVLR